MEAVPYPHDEYVQSLSLPMVAALCSPLACAIAPRQRHGLILADDDGAIVEQILLEGVFSVDHAVGWALGMNHVEDWPTVVFVSVVEHRVGHVDALDIWEFERMRYLLGTFDMELRDWLLADGLNVRSMAYTALPEAAWLSDPLEVRTAQLRRADPGVILPLDLAAE